ncbi:MAG: Gfo/Idh/MocA family oxidoreductase [bacterium]
MAARIGVVGIGWWACFNHIPTLQASPDVEAVAICDLNAERLAEVGDRFGIVARYTDVAEMVRAERLDGVIVSTPHVAHVGPSIAAMKAGAHVMVEKPMATTAADGRAIAAAGVEFVRQVFVPTGLNYTRYSAVAAGWIRDGRIGTVRHAVCQMGSALADLMAGEPMLETTDHLYRPPASTWADPAKAGGYAWGQMSHSVGWLCFVADLRMATIYCLDGKSPTGVDYYDAAVGRATNGASVSFSGASTIPKHRGMQTDVRIFGTEGVIFFDCEGGRARLELTRLDGTNEVYPMAEGEADYDGALPVRHFAEFCAGKPVGNPADGEIGARVTETIAAMYRSAASGKVEAV